jgi:hypothetical protein
MRHAATGCGRGGVPIFGGGSKPTQGNVLIQYAHAICGIYFGKKKNSSSASSDGHARSRNTLIPAKNESVCVVEPLSSELESSGFQQPLNYYSQAAKSTFRLNSL